MKRWLNLLASHTMTVTLTPKLEQVVQALVASGRFDDERAVIRAGLRLLQHQETVRLADLPDGHGNATVAELLAEADADTYTDWNPQRDFAAVRAELHARLKALKRKAK